MSTAYTPAFLKRIEEGKNNRIEYNGNTISYEYNSNGYPTKKTEYVTRYEYH